MSTCNASGFGGGLSASRSCERLMVSLMILLPSAGVGAGFDGRGLTEKEISSQDLEDDGNLAEEDRSFQKGINVMLPALNQ